MKTKTTIKAIKERYGKIFYCGYCDLQNIMKYTEPTHYNSGVFGWNCDIYTEYGIAITTGYRNMAGKRIPDEIIEKYDTIAKEILKNTFKKDYDKIKEELEENKQKFFEELFFL